MSLITRLWDGLLTGFSQESVQTYSKLYFTVKAVITSVIFFPFGENSWLTVAGSFLSKMLRSR